MGRMLRIKFQVKAKEILLYDNLDGRTRVTQVLNLEFYLFKFYLKRIKSTLYPYIVKNNNTYSFSDKQN